MKTIIILQARMLSKRLPGKVLKKILGKPMIELIIRRLKNCKEVDEIIVATSKHGSNQKLIEHLKKIKINYFRGSEEDALNRYYNAAKKNNAKIIIRITADCPLADPRLVDEFVRKFKKEKVEYLSNTFPYSYPDGLDIEVFSFEFLSKVFKKAKSSERSEGVVLPFFRRNYKKIKFENILCPIKNLKFRWVVDYEIDLKLVTKIYEHFSPKINFSWIEALKFANKNRNMSMSNLKYQHNHGSKISDGQKIWLRAKEIIPGGNMLLSKNPDLFLPDKWPAYFKKTKGYSVWGVDNKKYADISSMGVGTNILGYSRREIDNEVKKVVSAGNLSTLNCHEEVKLAERLLGMHPWAEMVKFTRTGGEANSVAIRIARSSTNRHKVGFCGYHGWHDWYLSSNLANKNNLGTHLFPGVGYYGVPKELKNTSYPFNYGNINQVEKLINEKNIGIIKMEVARSTKPNINFLKKIKNLCTKKNIILIFDECTSGFRETFGGIHKKIGIEPDMVIYGKALGNGYAINAIVGKRSIMENAKNTFISSTFWTERIGPAAALKTLEIMEKIKSWEIITNAGKNLIKNWKNIARENNLNIEISGIPALAQFNFKLSDNLAIKTFVTQEMLKINILATNIVYLSTAHDNKIMERYYNRLNEIFRKIKQCQNKDKIENYLESPISQNHFRRLN